MRHNIVMRIKYEFGRALGGTLKKWCYSLKNK